MNVSPRWIDQLQIAAPCSARWEDMDGDERTRTCTQCRLEVHNFVEMTEAEIAALLSSGERVCGRLYRRPDGTILTRDCPVGWRAMCGRVSRWGAVLAVSLVALMQLSTSWGLGASRQGGPAGTRLARLQPFATVVRWLRPAPPCFLAGRIMPMPPPINVQLPVLNSGNGS